VRVFAGPTKPCARGNQGDMKAKKAPATRKNVRRLATVKGARGRPAMLMLDKTPI
jgi:hypothetical protein